MTDTNAASYLETANLHTVPAAIRVFRKTLVAADVVDENRILFFKIPPKSKVADALAAVEDIDSSTGVTFFAGLTDGSTVKNLIGTSGSPKTTGQAGGVVRLDQVDAVGFVIPNSNWYAFVQIKDAPTGFQAGDLALMVAYTSVLDNGA